jgi:hypothetical protein
MGCPFIGVIVVSRRPTTTSVNHVSRGAICRACLLPVLLVLLSFRVRCLAFAALLLGWPGI